MSTRKRLNVKPVLVYLQSTLHSPTGTILAPGRRREIARLVAEGHVPLVEDLALADLAWRLRPAHRDRRPHASVAVVGSLSDVLGWPPGRLLARSGTVGTAIRPDQGHPRPRLLGAQPAAGRAPAPRSLRERLDPAAHRRSPSPPRCPGRSAAPEAAVMDLDRAQRGSLPLGQDPRRLVGGIRPTRPRHGVAVATPQALSATNSHLDRLRLSFAGSPHELEEGVHRLAFTWKSAGFRQ